MGRAGLMQGALYLIRPDGYIGLCDPNAQPATLHRYLDERGLAPGAASAPAPKPRKRTAAKAPPVKRGAGTRSSRPSKA